MDGMNRRSDSTQYVGPVAMFRTAVERLLAADKGKHGDDGLSAALDAGTKRATLALQLALDRAGRF
jgi:hypothetical protein